MSRRYKQGQSARDVPDSPRIRADDRRKSSEEFEVQNIDFPVHQGQGWYSREKTTEEFLIHAGSEEFAIHPGNEEFPVYPGNEEFPVYSGNEFPVYSGNEFTVLPGSEEYGLHADDEEFPGYAEEEEFPVYTGDEFPFHAGNAMESVTYPPNSRPATYSRYSQEHGVVYYPKPAHQTVAADEPARPAFHNVSPTLSPTDCEEDLHVHFNTAPNYSPRRSSASSTIPHNPPSEKSGYTADESGDTFSLHTASSIGSNKEPQVQCRTDAIHYAKQHSLQVSLDDDDMAEMLQQDVQKFADDVEFADVVRCALGDYVPDTSREYIDNNPDVYLPSSLGIDFREFYFESLVKLCNAHLPIHLQADDINTGFRDGRALHGVLKSLTRGDIGELPFPNPKAFHQQRKNTQRILAVIMAPYLGATFQKLEPKLSSYAENFTKGDEIKTACVITMLFDYWLIKPIEHAEYTGIRALQVWLMKCGVSFAAYDKFDIHATCSLDLPDNMREIVQQYAPFLMKDMAEMGKMGTVTEQMQFCLKFFEVHYGVPQILFPDYDLFEERCTLDLYRFLQIAWSAELFVSMKNSVKRPQSKILMNCPKSYINEMLGKYQKMEERCQELSTCSSSLYNDLQGWINKLKHCYEGISCDLTKNKETLAVVRQMITNCMSAKTRQFAKITQLTALLQSSIKLWNKEDPSIIDHPKYLISNLQNMFETVMNLHRAIEQQIKKKAQAKELGREYQEALDRKCTMIRCWQLRWERWLVDGGADRYNVPILNMRRKLLNKLELELESMKEEIEQLHLLRDGIVQTGQITLNDKFALEKRCQGISDEFDTFLVDVQMATASLKEREVEARDLDSMYCEEAVLMANLDMQLHHSYNFFSYRPTCNSLLDVQNLTAHSLEARNALFDTAAQLDALYSLNDQIENLNKVQAVPPNSYTSFTVKHIAEHWERVLVSVSELEGWLSQQLKLWTLLDQKYANKLHQHLDILARELRYHMSGLIVPVDDVKKINKRECQLTILKCRVQQTSHRISHRLEKSFKDLFELAKPLHERGIITPRVGALLHATDHCLTAIELLKEDVDTQFHLIKHREGGSDEDASIQDICDYYHRVRKQVLLSRQNLQSLVQHDYDLEEDRWQSRPVEEPDYGKITHFSDVLDPYQRITCSMWLDVRHAPDYHRKTAAKCAYLTALFALLADHKPYLTEAVLREIVGEDNVLFEYCKRHCTEYFGGEMHLEKGVKCYDYKRFVCNLLDMHQKLTINPN